MLLKEDHTFKQSQYKYSYYLFSKQINIDTQKKKKKAREVILKGMDNLNTEFLNNADKLISSTVFLEKFILQIFSKTAYRV